MTASVQRLRMAVMAMTDLEQLSLAQATDDMGRTHLEPRMRAFYSALCSFIEEAAVAQRVASHALPAIVDPFGEFDDASGTS